MRNVFYLLQQLKARLKLKSADFVQGMFRDYYIRDYTPKSSISTIEQREFGFIMFEGWMHRHKSFKQIDELREFLQNSVPSDAYYSCAYYESPEAEMDKKGWIGADLIFDIDADHIPTSCNKIHDEWICGGCGFSGKGILPEKCPVCGGEKFNSKTWPCEICLASAKDETMKLLDMLTEDFGFSANEIHIFFSGHRGYHISVGCEAVMMLDSIARKEIVDYVSGLGLDISSYDLTRKELASNHGWFKRLNQGIPNFIINAKDEDLRNIGLKKNVIDALSRNRNSISSSLLGTGKQAPSVRGVGPDSWKKIAEHVAKLQSAKIDTVVTTDIHRLIRLTDTLHGKTGFLKIEFPVSTIDSFDPFKDAIAFKEGTATVNVSNAPEFRLGEEMFGPYRDKKVELPTAAALLLICKGRAEVVE
jgi:DNA primase small subunit